MGKSTSKKRSGHSQRIRIRQRINPKIVAGVLISLFAFGSFFIYSNFFNNHTAYAAVNYSWKGLTDDDWNNSLNWLPIGVPGSGDNITIGLIALHQVKLTSPVIVGSVTVNSGGIINLNGFDLTVSGTSTINKDANVNLSGGKWIADGNGVFNGGTIFDVTGGGQLLCKGSSTTFGYSNYGPVINVDISVNSSSIKLMNTEFNGITSLTKNGTSNDQSSGNNVFNGVTEITTNNTGYFLLASTKNDVYNNDVTFNSFGAGIIYPAYRGTNTEFNGNVSVNNTGTGGVRFGASTGTATIANNKSFNIGTTGFAGGLLMLSGLNFSDTSAFTINLPATTVLQLGPNTSFAGDFIAECGGFCLSGSTFNGSSTFIKTGSTNDRGAGSNIFNGPTSITNSGTGYLLMSNNTGDIFNADVTFTCLNNGIIYPAYNGSGNEFNQNIIVNSIGSGGVRIGANTGVAKIADSKRVIVGSEGFSDGILTLGNFTSEDTSAQSITLTGKAIMYLGSNSSFAGEFTAEAGGFCLNGATFNKGASFTKTGISNDQGSGSNVFNGPVSFTNHGTGYLLMCSSKNDIFNAEVTFTCTNSGIIYPAYRGTQTEFNDNIIVNSTGAGGVRIGANVGSSKLAAGKKIIVGSEGFSSGQLILGNMTIADTLEQSFVLTGNSILTIGPFSSFGGNVNFTAGGLCLSGAVYNGNANFIKTGSSNDQGTGDNIFNGTTSIRNEGTGYVLLAASKRDIFNGPTSLSSSSSGLMHIAYRGDTTLFNDDLTLSCIGGGGIQFGSSTGTTELASGKLIKVGSEGFDSGILMLKKFYSPGNVTQSFPFTGSSVLSLGPASLFAGDVSAECGGISLNGTTFGGSASFTKTGTTNDQGTGDNIFNGPTTIKNEGSGYILLASTTRDIFNGPTTLTCTNSGTMHIAYRGIKTEFNDDLTVNCTGTGGIRMGSSTGTSELASGKLIKVGTDGFSEGILILKNFSSPGSVAQSFNFTSNAVLSIGPSSNFGGDVTADCGGVALCGATFDGAATFYKTGSSNDQGTGSNIFNGTTSITNSGTGYLMLSSVTKDIFNKEVKFSITNSGIIYSSYKGIDNEYNDNVIVSSTGTGSIRFGANNGTSTIANGKTLTIGPDGFSGGYLQLNKVTQSGNTPQIMDVSTGTAAIYFNSGSTFDGLVNIRFPQVYLNGAVFNNTTTIEKTGAGNNAGTGACVFNGPTTIINSGTGVLYLGNSSADDYNSDVTFIQTGTGALRPAHNGTNKFSGNISIAGSTSGITFAASNGNVTLDGTSLQTITGENGITPIFRRLVINNGGHGLLLNTPISVTTSLTLTNGNINTTDTTLLIIENGVSTVGGVSDASYVNGPIRKVGNQAFEFPIGKNGFYRPIHMSAPSRTTDHFTAEYFQEDPHSKYNTFSVEAGIDHVSRCEYWNLNKTNGTSNVNVSLTWAGTSCGVSNPAELAIAGWDTTQGKWRNYGNGGVVGNATAGTMVTNSTVSNFGAFTLSSSTSNNALPVELTNFDANISESKVLVEWTTASEINNDYFTIERGPDGEYFEAIGTVKGSGNTTTTTSYQFEDDSPLSGISYYRLRQTDYDGKFELFEPVSVNFKGKDMEFIIESVGPNPFSNMIRIDYFSPENAELILILSGLDGSLAFSQRINVYAGNGTYSTGQLPGFSPGIYILKLLRGEAILDTRKLVKN